MDESSIQKQVMLGAQALSGLAAVNMIMRSESNMDIFDSMVSSPEQKDMLTKIVGFAGVLTVMELFMDKPKM